MGQSPSEKGRAHSPTSFCAGPNGCNAMTCMATKPHKRFGRGVTSGWLRKKNCSPEQSAIRKQGRTEGCPLGDSHRAFCESLVGIGLCTPARSTRAVRFNPPKQKATERSTRWLFLWRMEEWGRAPSICPEAERGGRHSKCRIGGPL